MKRGSVVLVLTLFVACLFVVGCAGGLSESDYVQLNGSWIHRLTLGDDLAKSGEWKGAYETYLSVFTDASRVSPPARYAQYHALFMTYLRKSASAFAARRDGQIDSWNQLMPEAETAQNAAYEELDRARAGVQ